MGKGLWLQEVQLAGAGVHWRRVLLIRGRSASRAEGLLERGSYRYPGHPAVGVHIYWLKGTKDSEIR